jgi:hypothetical protein
MDELVNREFQALRELIATNERARDASLAVEREARRTEKVELDGRLNRMNEFRQAMADQAGRFIARGEFEEAIKAGVQRYEASRDYADAQLHAALSPLRSDVDRIQRPDWGFISAVAGLLVAMVAGCWLIIGLEIDNKVGPLRVDLEQTRTATTSNNERLRFVETATSNSTQADVASRADRSQINERLHQLEDVSPLGQQAAADVSNLKASMLQVFERIQQLRTSATSQAAALVEIETQFCGQDSLRSQIHAQDLRTTAMLWKKVYGDEMPISNAFYARVGRCFAQSTASGSQ